MPSPPSLQGAPLRIGGGGQHTEAPPEEPQGSYFRGPCCAGKEAPRAQLPAVLKCLCQGLQVPLCPGHNFWDFIFTCSLLKTVPDAGMPQQASGSELLSSPPWQPQDEAPGSPRPEISWFPPPRECQELYPQVSGHITSQLLVPALATQFVSPKAMAHGHFPQACSAPVGGRACPQTWASSLFLPLQPPT